MTGVIAAADLAGFKLVTGSWRAEDDCGINSVAQDDNGVTRANVCDVAASAGWTSLGGSDATDTRRVNKENEAMIKKLTKHGNCLALVIDKPVLDLLKINAETPLEISTDGQVLIVAPAIDIERKAKFKAALETTNRRHGKALKRLAE